MTIQCTTTDNLMWCRMLCMGGWMALCGATYSWGDDMRCGYPGCTVPASEMDGETPRFQELDNLDNCFFYTFGKKKPGEKRRGKKVGERDYPGCTRLRR